MLNVVSELAGTRRYFMMWLIGTVPLAFGVSKSQIDNKLMYSRLSQDFLIVDGWVLPSFYFD